MIPTHKARSQRSACATLLSPFERARPPVAVAAVAAAALLSAAASVPAWGQAAGLPLEISEALRAGGVPEDAVSMLVLPAEGGPPRLDHLGQVVRQPASVIKLFTTGAALQTLGPAFTWQTDVALGGPLRPDGSLLGPLYLRGSGDPSLVMENVWLMMARWRAAGLRDIRGGFVIDRQAFDLPAHDPAAFDGEPLRPYNAGPDALLLNHQAITLRLMPDAARPNRVRVSMEPELDGVRLESWVSLQRGVPCGAWRENLSVEMRPAPPLAWTLSVRGPYPEACLSREWPLLWHGDGVGDHAGRMLRQIWRGLGGEVGGEVAYKAVSGDKQPAQVDAWPPGTPVWQSWASPPLARVVQDINKFSNNVMARQLFLSLAPLPGPATLDKARAAVSAQVRGATRDTFGRSPCDGDALVLDNGSGLSREERSSAWCLGRWLQTLWASPVMPEFVASMPVTGVDGTARRVGNGTAGRAHIKTGSLEGVVSLAGVVHGESGRRHVVVAMVNHPRAQAARPALDALLVWAVRYR